MYIKSTGQNLSSSTGPVNQVLQRWLYPFCILKCYQIPPTFIIFSFKIALGHLWLKWYIIWTQFKRRSKVYYSRIMINKIEINAVFSIEPMLSTLKQWTIFFDLLFLQWQHSCTKSNTLSHSVFHVTKNTNLPNDGLYFRHVICFLR